MRQRRLCDYFLPDLHVWPLAWIPLVWLSVRWRQFLRCDYTVLGIQEQDQENFLLSRTARGELSASPRCNSSRNARRDISSTACSCTNFACPMPFVAQKSASLADTKRVRLPNLLSNSHARSTALFPATPVRRKIASNSASESEAAPRVSSFSADVRLQASL